ncbi:hypothetical protein HDZ31DRAFT_82905 [Schizophyllum fasciatum]
MDSSAQTFEWLANIPPVKTEPSWDTSLFYSHSSSSLPSQSLLSSEPRRPRSATTISGSRARPYPAVVLKASRSEGACEQANMRSGYTDRSSSRMGVARAGSDGDQYYRSYTAQQQSGSFPDSASDQSETRPPSSSGSGNVHAMYGVVGADVGHSNNNDVFGIGAMNWTSQDASASLSMSYTDPPSLSFSTPSGATLSPSSAYHAFDPAFGGAFHTHSPESLSVPSTLPDTYTGYGNGLGDPDSPNSSASFMPSYTTTSDLDQALERSRQLEERLHQLQALYEQAQAQVRQLSTATQRTGPPPPSPAFQHEWRARTDARVRQFCALNRAGNALCAWHDSRRERRAFPPRMAPAGHLNCGCTYEEALFEESLARHGVGSYHPGESVRMDPALRNPLLQLLRERYGYRDGDFERDPRTGDWVEGEGAARWEQSGTPNKRARAQTDAARR